MNIFTKAAFTLLCILVGYTQISAQSAKGSISGTVKTNDGEPAEQVSISIKGLRKTSADQNGRYLLKEIPAGNYVITANFIGLASQSQNVTVEAGRETIINFILTESNQQLQEVVVNLGQTNRFSKRETPTPARMPLKNLENPQIYNVVGTPLMREQIVVERTDLYRNIPGAVPNFSAGGSQGLTQRGFANTNGLRNGMGTSAIYPMNPAILESVEVMKGPSGTLFGSSRSITFGGVYNYVTKKPLSNNITEVGLTAGSFDFARATADVNVVLDKDGKKLLRVNSAWQSEGSFQDQGYGKNFVFAPVFSYQINDNLKFLVDVDITRNSYTTTSFLLPSNLDSISFRTFRDFPLDYKRSLSNNSVDSKVGVNNIAVDMDYRFSDSWKSQTKFLYSEGFYDRLLWGTFTIANDSTIIRNVRNQAPETFGNIQIQQNFIGDFKLGTFRNRVVAGMDYNRNYNVLNRVTVNYGRMDIKGLGNPDFNKERIDVLSAGKFGGSTFSGTSYGMYVSDVFNITPSLMTMISLRLDYYKTAGSFAMSTGKYSGGYDQASLSPKLGLVYQPIRDKLSLFVNYMNGFANLSPALQQPNGEIEGLKPQYANQMEGGAKFNVMNGKISGSLSYYDIKVTNSVRTETVSGQVISVQDGTQNSTGFELDLTANPISELNIVAGYAYNENKYTRAGVVKASPTRTVPLTGKYLAASPKNVANIWASYSFFSGELKGLGFGAGVNYVDNSWFDSINEFTLPSYTLVGASVFYAHHKFRIGLKGNNLLNQQYWNSTGMPQKPANFLTEIRFRF